MDFFQNNWRKDHNRDTDGYEGIGHVECRETRHDKVREIAVDKIHHHGKTHAVDKVSDGTAQNHHDTETTHPVAFVDRLVEPQKDNGRHNRDQQEK